MGSNRIISVPTIALDVLSKYKAWQLEQAEQLGTKWIQTERIFTSWNGTPMSADAMSKWFPKFIRRHDLPKITFHGLRHTGASLLFDMGLTPADVGKRLGHSITNTTMAIYVHALKRADKIAGDKMDSLLNSLTKTP